MNSNKRPELPHLPISALLPDIVANLTERNELVVQAAPGAGKTTLVPLAFLNAPWLQQKRLIMLQPRRVAAKTAAARMAQLLNEPVGETVGYTIRLEQMVSSRTRIEVVTEGILTRRLQQDPALEQVALVIFDEFHERSIHSDLGLALCLQSRELFRDGCDPLKLLVMSATLDAEPVAGLLGGAPLLTSSGQSFPVSLHYSPKRPERQQLIASLTETTLSALHQHSGDCLVFLPGQREIHQLAARLTPRLPAEVTLMPLYGNLSLAQQQAVLAPASTDGKRKLVLATDIAETSLTIDGVKIVIDSGLARKPQFDPRTGMTRLNTIAVSQASSIQRAGRAGRLSEGVCYRLWNETQQHQLNSHSVAEILQADLTPLALQLLQWGVNDPSQLRWLDTPAKPAFQQALSLLLQFGAIDHLGASRLTPHGERMADLAMHPRLAHMLLVAKRESLTQLGATLAAILGDRTPQTGDGADLEPFIGQLSSDRRSAQTEQAWRNRCLQQAAQFMTQIGAAAASPPLSVPPHDLGFLIASAFPDRIAKRRHNSRTSYQLANGRAASLAETDTLAGTDWLAVAEVGGFAQQREDRIFLAARLDPSLFDDALAQRKRSEYIVAWQDGRLIAEERVFLGAILLSQIPLPKIGAAQKSAATVAFVRDQGLSVLPWTDSARQLRTRVSLVRRFCSPEAWPDFSDSHLMASLDTWLAPYLGQVDTLSDLKKLDLTAILSAQLVWPQPNQLDELAPERLTVPSGSAVNIDYTREPPALEVKLQEMFGCQQTPTVVNGKVALSIHLLSPARRPLQITQDISGFWLTGYPAIKKEMKGRYPKHPWPDDPLAAPPTRHTKKFLAAEKK